MRFIPTDSNMNDIPYGNNGYYCSTMTQAGEYIQLFIQLIEVFQNTPTFRPFYILCLYYNFMSYVQGYIETSLAHATLYQARGMVCILIKEKYKYYKCSDPAFLQALISIIQQINPKVEFQANKDSLLIVPQPISIQQCLNKSPEADIRNKIGQTGLLAATPPMLNLKRGRNQTQLDNSIEQHKISQNPQTLNVKQSLQVLRRINRLKASAIKKKQQLGTQNLVDHVNREAIDHSNDEPINVFTIKEQRHSNDNESDNESDHGSINEDEIENILSPPYLPYSSPHLDSNDLSYPPIEDEHTSSVKKLRSNLEPRSDSDNDSDLDIDSIEEPELIPDRGSNSSPSSSSSSSSSSSHLSMFIPRTVYMATSTRQSPPWLIDSGAAISGTSAHCDITNSINCNIPITPAFGSIIRATTEGAINDPVLSPMCIRVLHVDDMHHRLLSVHQICAGSNNNQRQVGVFTDEGCRFFPLDTCWDALKLLSNKKQTFYGLAHNGVYLYSPDANSKWT